MQSIRRHVLRLSLSFLSLQATLPLALGIIALAAVRPVESARAAEEPILRVDGDGPTSSVTALAFSPDGRRLYTAGLDKVVRVWHRNEETGRFELQPAATLRVPIGPADEGFIYCIAVSPNGKWLAVGGRGAHRASPGFRQGGFLTPREAVRDTIRADDGQIYLFDLATGEARVLRGHLGPVLALQFSAGDSPVLYSIGRTEVYDQARKRWSASVRRFDVQSGKHLGGKLLPEPGGLRPGLAVLSADPRRDNADRAVLAWGDGNLRVWDSGANSLDPQGFPAAGQLNSTAVADDLHRRVITGSFVQQHGASRLQLWEELRGSPYLRALPNPLSLGRTGNVIYHPQAMALLPSTDNGRPNLLAVLLQNVQLPNVTIGWELRLYEYGATGIGPARSPRIPLPDFGRSTTAPALAASSGGHVAMAVGSDDVVLVFSVADLIAGRNPQPQRLSSTAPLPGSAGFVRKNGSLGLLIEDEKEGTFVYDFGARAVTSEEGWTADTDTARNWTVEVEKSEEDGQIIEHVVVTSPAGGRRPIRVTMPPGHQVTARRVVIPAPREGQAAANPVLVVASDVSLSPTLAVYDLADRSLLRQYSGHTSTIRSIEGSADGRLLVTSGDDHTVRVWSLVDLPTGPDVRGGMPGFGAKAADEGGLIVDYVASVGPAAGKLRPGDRIVAVRDTARRLTPSDAESLFEFLEGHRAGDQIAFELASGREVSVRLAPAADERKPLFTMYFTRERDGNFQWVGWSPLGPFDSSDQQIEQDLGWHFNTPGAPRPARFARLEEYPEFRRRGVIQEMLQTAMPPRTVRAALSPPALELSLADFSSAGTPDVAGAAAGGARLLRTPGGVARLTLVGLAPRDIAKVEVRVNDEPVGEMQRSVGQDWTLALDGAAWQRGTYEVQAVVETNEPEPQFFAETLRLRYQPPAPQIEFLAPRQTHVSDPRLPVSANVKVSAGQPCRVELIHLHAGQRVAASDREWNVSGSQQIEHEITLQEGINEIELRAANDAALPGFEQHEETRTELVVHYAPAPPPEISVAVIMPDSSTDQEALRPLPIGGRVEITRPQPELRLELTGGTAVSAGTLKLVEFGTESELSIALDLPQADKPVTRALDVREPGEYVLSLQANTPAGAIEVFRGTLVLAAPLPDIRVVRPEAGIQLIAGRDEPVALLEANLDREGIAYPFEATILRNGIPLELTPTLEDETLSASVPIEPGANYLQILLSNGFRRFATNAIPVTMIQPPRVEKVEWSVHKEPLCDLRIVGRSATPLQTLRINGQGYPAETLQISHDGDRWQAEIPAFPLQPGANPIEIVAFNRDGAALAPHTVEIPYEEPEPPAKAIVRIVRPAAETVSQPLVEVEFTVATETPLRRYEIYRNDVKVAESTSAEEIATDPEGRTVYKVQREVSLSSQGNNLRVVVVNDGGAEEVVLPTLSYIRPPASFKVTGVTLVSDPKQVMEPALTADGSLEFPRPAGDNLVYIDGTASWLEEAERPAGVMALVNEFQWPAVRFDDIGPNEATFRIPALLNKDTNQIILTSTYDKDAAEPRSFVIQCAKPADRVLLHLLVVGVGIPQEQRQELLNRAWKSLGLQGPAEGQRQAGTFDQVITYGPLVGSDLGFVHVFGELNAIRKELDTRGPDSRVVRTGSRACDVVMLYYEGGQVVTTDRGPGISTRPVDDRAQVQLWEHTLPVAYLESYVRELHGAQVMLLELARNPELPSDSEFPRWSNKTRTAVFRYVWLGGRGAAAEGSTLLSALGQLAPIIRLADLDSALNQIAAGQRELVDYDRHLPPGMESLTLGR